MTNLSRRAILRSLAAGAGGAMLLPFMSRLTSANTPKVARFLFIVEGNCFYPRMVLDAATQTYLEGTGIDLTTMPPANPNYYFWPNAYKQTSVHSVDSTDSFGSALGLKDFATTKLADNTPVGSQAAVVYGLSSTITGGGHTAYQGALSSSRCIAGSPSGETIDSYLAGIVGWKMSGSTRVAATPFDAIRLAAIPIGTSEPISYATCASGVGGALGAITDPVAAYNTLFGVVGTSAAAQAAFNTRNTLLDYANANVQKAFQYFSGSSGERQKLESYLTSIEALQARQMALSGMESKLQTVLQGAGATLVQSNADTTTFPDYTKDYLEHFAAHLELAVVALQGQLTNVAVVTCGTGGDFGGITYPDVVAQATGFGIGAPSAQYATQMRHPIQHAFLASDANAELVVQTATRYQLQQVALAAQALSNVADPAGSGTMLDNTLIVFVSDNGEQHHSQALEFPVVLLGGKNLRSSGGAWGKTLVYPGIPSGAKNPQLSNLWNTLTYFTGQGIDNFGKEGPLRNMTGPLSELM